MSVPVLLVHGIWNDGGVFDPMRKALERAGVRSVVAIDLEPNDGRASIAELARQVENAVHRMLRELSVPRIDVVGFSMGALVTRYCIQRLEGKTWARRFVSISGPHKGTVHAWFPGGQGVRDMRRDSALLKDLESDADPWGDTELHCFWTPFDLMILPASSSVMARARSVRRFPVGMHRWMVTDRRVLDAVSSVLTA